MAVTRRQFLGSTAGLAVAASLPLAWPAPALARTAAAVGATVNLGAYGTSTFLDGAQILDRYVGMPLATSYEKIYMSHGQFGSAPATKMAQLATTGCQFLVSVKPSTSLTASEQKAMAKWLAMLKARGMRVRIALYSEPNDKAFQTAAQWLPYWRFYAPVIKDAGVTLVYEPGCGPTAVVRAEELFPSSPPPDELWVDYYATSFRGGSTLTKILQIAASHHVPAGIGEWGWQAGNASGPHNPVTMADWKRYGAYLVNLITTRKITLGALYFNARFGNLTSNIITGPSDPRIPVIHDVVQAFS